MTIDDRYILDLDDLQKIRVECAKCSTAVVIASPDFTTTPVQCPNCTTQLVIGDGTEDLTIRQLAKCLSDIPRIKTLRIRFEITRPKN